MTDNPSLLTLSATEKPGYAAGEKLWKPRTISREEVARFLFEEGLGLGSGGESAKEGEGKWVGKAVDVAWLKWW